MNSPEDRFGNESRDCTVIAVSHCLGISYKEAHDKLAGLGRSPNMGFPFRIEYVNTLGIVVRTDIRPRTFKEVYPLLKQGRFIVRIKGHVFAVVDGVIYDSEPSTSRKKVYAVYEKR